MSTAVLDRAAGNGPLTDAGTVEMSLADLVDLAIEDQPKRKARRSKRRRDRNPTAFYGHIAEAMESERCPCCDIAKAAFAGVTSDSLLAAAPVRMDNENLKELLAFLRYVLETLLPFILGLL